MHTCVAVKLRRGEAELEKILKGKVVAKDGIGLLRFCRTLRVGEIDGGQGRNRTTDTRIFSPLLYRLSYLAPVYNRYPMGNRILLLPALQRPTQGF